MEFKGTLPTNLTRTPINSLEVNTAKFTSRIHERHLFVHFIVKSSSFARFVRTFLIFVYFAATVAVLELFWWRKHLTSTFHLQTTYISKFKKKKTVGTHFFQTKRLRLIEEWLQKHRVIFSDYVLTVFEVVSASARW